MDSVIDKHSTIKYHKKLSTWKSYLTKVNSIMTTDYQDNIFIFNFTPFNNNSNSSSTGDYVFEPNITVIVTYMLLFLIAAIGNLTVFISLFRSRHRRSRISLMIRHLAIADLIVTFVMIPIEVSKNYLCNKCFNSSEYLLWNICW